MKYTFHGFMYKKFSIFIDFVNATWFLRMDDASNQELIVMSMYFHSKYRKQRYHFCITKKKDIKIVQI